jgi:hypothetical protein
VGFGAGLSPGSESFRSLSPGFSPAGRSVRGASPSASPRKLIAERPSGPLFLNSSKELSKVLANSILLLFMNKYHR